MNGYFHICPLFCAKSIYIFLMQLSCLCSNHEDICTDIFMIFHSVTYIFVQNLFKFFWRNLTVSVQPLSLHSLFCLNEILWDYVPYLCKIYLDFSYTTQLSLSSLNEKSWRYLSLTYFVQNLFRFFWRNLTVSVQPLALHRLKADCLPFTLNWNRFKQQRVQKGLGKIGFWVNKK